MDVHLGDRQHDGPRGASPPLQGPREERLVAAPALGHLHGDGAGGRVHFLRLVAVGVALARVAALVTAGAEVPVALHPHGEIEERGERLGHALRPGLDELFHQRGDNLTLGVLHPVPLFGD
ncbi:hypothetical protein GGD89_002954 [Roseospira visakhapatnamensis]|uniref:Uncharacterized protein n=1 Tax=Roseospira visakhapatnamensis TaxID=390880 RepID=A0A7W6RG89_9PROT|nr:hypothetical protein [Roseospira visakhapatnamensis]